MAVAAKTSLGASALGAIMRMKASIELRVRKAISDREAARTDEYHAVQRARIESHRTFWP